MEEQDLASRECEVEIRTLPDDADQALHFDLLCPHVVITDPHLTTGWPHARGQNSDRRRLARAVWTKQSEDLSATNIERQSIQRYNLARGLVLVFAAWNKPTACGKWWR